MRRSVRPAPVRVLRWFSFRASGRQRKNGHLRRRTVPRVLWPNWLEADLIAKADGRCFRPFGELGSGPFETVIAVAHFPRRKGREQHVVLAVRSGDHHVAGPRELE